MSVNSHPLKQTQEQLKSNSTQHPISRSYSSVAMAQNDYKFEGWVGDSPASADGNLRWAEFEPKPWEETDIDIQVTHCGICASDLSMMRSHWVSFRYLTPTLSNKSI
jgi:hypothetical protein